MRTLVVDDSRTMRRIIRTTLEERQGDAPEILEASDGVEALQLLRNEKLEIDLVLIDWNMPRLDGLGFLKQLKLVSPFREIQVIMVTSMADRASVAEALRWGASDYVVKPFAPEVLQEKIRKVASRIESRRSAETQVILRSMVADGTTSDDRAFLDQLPPDLVEELRAIATPRSHDKGEILVSPRAPVDALGVVLQGEIEIVASPPGPGEVRRTGDCFGERSFVSGEPAGLTILARTAVRTLALSRAQVADLSRRRREFGYALSRCVTRSGRPRGQAPAAPHGLAGRLETMPMADLVQVLHICRKTGHLRLHQGNGSASLFVVDGEVRHALAGDIAGEEAFYRLLAWTEAAFAFESGTRTDEATVSLPTMTLLMEGLRRVDEGRLRNRPSDS
ncbi:MAG TPA: response regulator [Planctomycetota bacterium]